MKKKSMLLATLAALMLPTAASPTVTVGGRLSIAYNQLTNDSVVAKQSQESASRIFIAGSEDLGHGTQILFRLEERFAIDTGAAAGGSAANGARWFGESKVGVSTSVGTVLLGRSYSILDTVIDSVQYEAHGGSTIAGSDHYGHRASVRWNNLAQYSTPPMGPVRLTAAVSLSEAPSVKNPLGIGANFALGKFRAALAWQRDVSGDQTASVTSTIGNSPWKTWVVGAHYDFGIMQLFGTAGRSKGYSSNTAGGLNLAGAKENFHSIGAMVPIGPGAARFQYARFQDTSTAGVRQSAQNQFGMSYWHGLSKRTTLQFNSVYKKQRNGYDGAAYMADSNAYSAGRSDSQTGFEVALRHTF